MLAVGLAAGRRWEDDPLVRGDRGLHGDRAAYDDRGGYRETGPR
jgi:hypothetical protein